MISVGLKLVFEKVEQFVQKVNHKCNQCQTLKTSKIFAQKIEQFGQKVNHKCDQCRTATSVGLKLVFEKVEQFFWKV